MTTTDALIHLATAGLGLTQSEPCTVPSLDELVVLAERNRVLAPVARAARDGHVANATPEFRAHLRRQAMRAAESTLTTHAAAAETIRCLTGIDGIRILKGCATAYLDYAHPADRFAADVDVLVPADRWDEAIAAVGDTTLHAFRPTWRREFGHAATVVRPNSVEIDVHVRLGPGFVGLAVPAEELLDDFDHLVIGGEACQALDGPGRLVHAAIHATWSEHRSLASALDVPVLVQRSGVDWREAVERARRWKIDGFFAVAIGRAWRSLQLAPHECSEWADHHRPDDRQRRALALAGSRARGNRLAATMALPIHRWPAYFGPMLVPSRKYVAERGYRAMHRARLTLDEIRGRPIRPR